jgi:hypothetical protein
MSILETIMEQNPEDEFLKADGLDEAIIGYDDQSGRLIYSMSKIIDILIIDDGMTEEEALEHYYYNIHGGYVGEKTPIWCNDYF